MGLRAEAFWRCVPGAGRVDLRGKSEVGRQSATDQAEKRACSLVRPQPEASPARPWPPDARWETPRFPDDSPGRSWKPWAPASASDCPAAGGGCAGVLPNPPLEPVCQLPGIPPPSYVSHLLCCFSFLIEIGGDAQYWEGLKGKVGLLPCLCVGTRLGALWGQSRASRSALTWCLRAGLLAGMAGRAAAVLLSLH